MARWFVSRKYDRGTKSFSKAVSKLLVFGVKASIHATAAAATVAVGTVAAVGSAAGVPGAKKVEKAATRAGKKQVRRAVSASVKSISVKDFIKGA